METGLWTWQLNRHFEHWMGVIAESLTRCSPGAILLIPIHLIYQAARAGALGVVCVCVWGDSDWRCRKKGQFRGSDGRGSGDWSEEVCSMVVPCCLNETFPPLERQRHRGSGRTDPAAEGAFVSSPHHQCWGITWGWEKKKGGWGGEIAEEFHSRNQAPLFLLFPAPPPIFFLGSAMGKEQELLEAARTGNLAAVEKLLSGKRQSAGTGSGSYGTGGSGNSGGHGASSHPLSSLLR